MSKKFSAARKRAFLTFLAESGNQSLSAELAKVSRSWVCLHRSTDAEFDAACREAIEVAGERLMHEASAPPMNAALRPPDEAGGIHPPLKGRGWEFHDGVELVARGTGGHGGGKRVQIGRARVKQWTPRTEQRFLAALAATCNVKAACAEVGLWPGSAYNHRKRQPRFARAWDDAIEIGYVRIEAALVENACASFSEREAPPEMDMPPMTFAEAIHLLHMYKHRPFNSGKAPGLKPRLATPEEAEVELGKAGKRLESWMKWEEGKKAAKG